jgi:hypothetical protein
MQSEHDKVVDVCSGRHKGNKQSREANQYGLSGRTEQRQEVLNLIRNAGPEGMTMKEVAADMGVQLNTVSGRGSELKKLGLAKESGGVRDGSAVLVLSSGVETPDEVAAYLNAKPEPVEPKKKALKPMSPATAKKERAAVKELYEGGNPNTYTPEWFAAANFRIDTAVELWSKEHV